MSLRPVLFVTLLTAAGGCISEPPTGIDTPIEAGSDDSGEPDAGAPSDLGPEPEADGSLQDVGGNADVTPDVADIGTLDVTTTDSGTDADGGASNDATDDASGDAATDTGSDAMSTDVAPDLPPPPACDDLVQNGDETDVDCGGTVCPACPVGNACTGSTDCESLTCDQLQCVLPKSCKAILDLGLSQGEGVYAIDADGVGPAMSADVWCDMQTDGGGYTFYKVELAGNVNASIAESYCALYGMQLFISRTANHRAAASLVARNANFGPDGSVNFMRMMGIYPKFVGARCELRPFHSGNANCEFRASDDGPFFVTNSTGFSEPNGTHGAIDDSLGYLWYTNDGTLASIFDHDDLALNVTFNRFMCDVGDKQ